MRVIRTIVLILVAIGALAPLARPSDFNWHGRLAPGQSVEIKGVNGAIHAERSSGTEVTVEATKSGRHNDPNSVTVQAVPHGDGVTICAVYPSSDWGRPNECQPGSGGRMNVNNNDVKVEFTVHVPAGARFIGRTVNGEVEAASLAGDVQAHTVNGKIRISTDFPLMIHGKFSGREITGAIGQGGPDLSLKTVNGSIELHRVGS